MYTTGNAFPKVLENNGQNAGTVCKYTMTGVPYNMSLSMAGLLHTKPASAWTSCASCHVQRHSKGDTVYLSIIKVAGLYSTISVLFILEYVHCCWSGG